MTGPGVRERRAGALRAVASGTRPLAPRSVAAARPALVAATLCIVALAPPLALAEAVSGSRTPAPMSAADYEAAVARGDAQWDQRARGERDGQPEREPILAAIAAYEAAVAGDPGRLEARWRLLRALHFMGEFVEREKDAKRRVFERATAVAEASMALLEARIAEPDRLGELGVEEADARARAAGLSLDDVARAHFWTGIGWGAWSQTVGLLRAVREGVATRLHRHTKIAVALEPDYDEGGPLRLLGSLHAQLPKLPFLTGWVDRDAALPLVERAYDAFPENPGNQLLLAETLLELEPARRDEAVLLLRAVASRTPREEMRIEDLAMQRKARDRLARMGLR